MFQLISEPKIDLRPERHYLGIRTIAPFKGMFAEVNKRFKELNKWVKLHKIEDAGPLFLRYHVIDMAGEMDVEVGIVVPKALSGDDRVKPGILPAGRYGCLTYSGSGLKGHGTLVNWIKTNGIPSDRWDDPKGDVFRCRYEMYLTDPKIEPRKKQWQIEVAIKLKES